MMRLSTLAIAACLLTSACGKKPLPTETEPSGTGAPPPTPQNDPPRNAPPDSPATPSAGAPVTTDFVPFNAFRAHAAKTLGVAPDQVQGGAVAEDVARRMPHTIGDALAYTMSLRSDPTRDVRGWVTLDGTVITPEQNLGKLMAAAGVWDKTPAVTAGKLAEHLAWSYGMMYRVLIEPENGAPAPRYQLGADGSGTFRFFLASSEPGPGGAGGGPSNVDEVVVALSADRKATLTKKRK